MFCAGIYRFITYCLLLTAANCVSCTIKSTSKDNVLATINSTIQQLHPLAYSAPDSVAKVCTAIFNKAKSIDYKKGQTAALLIQGSIESLKGNYDSAIQIHDKALAIAETDTATRLKAEIYNEIGVCYDYKSDYNTALTNYQKALSFFGQAKDSLGYVKVKNNIGLIYQNLDEKQLAKTYFENALNISRRKNFVDEIAMALSNLAAVENEMGQHQLALQHFKEVLAFDMATGSETYISYSYNNIGNTFYGLQQMDSALFYINKSISLKEQLGLKSGLLNSYKILASIYLSQNKLDDAATYVKKAFNLAIETGTTEYKADCFELKANIEKQKKNWAQAYAAIDSFHTIKDSISNAKFKAEIIAKEKDAAIQKATVALQQEKLLVTASKNKNFLYLTIAGALAIIAALLFYSFRKQTALNKKLTLQQAELNHLNNALTIQNEAISLQKDQIEEGLEMKNQFLSFMAHEIRNPLSGIIGLTNIMMDNNPTESQREYLTYLKQSGNTLMNLLNEVLDYQKLVAGKIELHHVSFNLKDVCMQADNLYSAQIKLKNIQYALHYDEAIPQHLIGDPIRMLQIISNLINNAVKFTPNGGQVATHVQLLSKSNKECAIKVAVIDNGTGISAEDQQTIFDMFVQTKSSSKKMVGTGLGLSLVKNLLNLMGSDIQLESEPGKGSNFNFVLRLTYE